ncbi:hypothetical protein DRN34_00040 [Thermococci archaeon]|nr:MAG: hypothetical protein DRN34_00040 [Thermococci archaeon]
MSKGQHALKYVYVELISTEGSKFDVVRGLFSGFKSKVEDDKEKEGDEFFLLYHEKAGPTVTSKVQPVTSLYNTKYYDIMHIEILKNDVKELVFMTKEEEDQQKAYNMLVDVVKEMLEEKRMYKDDEGIIDVATYNSIPTDRASADDDVKSTDTTATRRRTAACGYNTNAGFNNYTHSYQKKEPEMTMLKRTKGRKPSKVALERMWAKLDEITEGVFEPKLPELQGDDEVEETEDNKNMGQYMT